MITDLTNAVVCSPSSSAVSTRSLLFAIPDDDRGEFENLPDSVRDDIDRRLIAFEEIHCAETSGDSSISRKCKELANRYLGRRGFSFDRLRCDYHAYKKNGGDWRILINQSKIPKRLKPDAAVEASISLSPVFIEFLKGLFQSNQRCSEPAIRLLYKMWRRGESIPGYGTWEEWFLDTFPHEPLPEKCPPEKPPGWSPGNLRRYIPEDAELALARQGKAAAMSHLPGVLTTREGLRPLEVILFDDVKTDFKVHLPGYSTPVDLNCLVAFDLATGVILRYGMRPAVFRDDGSKDKLKLRDMKVLIAGLLLQWGIPRNYKCTFVVENQTATVREGTALALAALSSGGNPDSGIQCSKTMMIQGTAIWAGYKDRALGNPNGKAALESHFNLMHNELGFEPGQTGRRYDLSPAELHGRTRESESLARSARYLTPERRAALRFPFRSYDEARVVITNMWNHVIRRTDHRMEAFETVPEWRTAKFQQWQPDWKLTETDLTPDQVEWNPVQRKESPWERWQRLVESVGGESAFTKLHPGAVARLYDEWRVVTVKDGEIFFDFEKQQYVYRVADAKFCAMGKTASVILPNGTKALAGFDTQDLSWIHLVAPGEDHGYLASLPRTRGIRRTDTLAAKAEVQRLQDQMTELQRTVSSRMPQVAEQRIEDLQHNVNVLQEALADSGAISVSASSSVESVESVQSVVSAPLPAFVQQIEQSKHALKVADRKAAARKQTAAELAEAADAALMTNLR